MPDRDVEFQIKATDQSARATESAADNFEHLGHEADKAARKLDDLGDESGQLSRKLGEARVAAAGLARQFDKTGDLKILKDFERANREAARLGRVAKTIKFDEPSFDARNFVGRLANAFEKLPGTVQTSAAATALVFVSALEGAVLAAVASGGLAAGLVLASKDERVKKAYAEVGTSIFASLKADASGFTGELLDIAPNLQKAFEKQSPRIKRIFDGLSRDIDPILDSIIAGVDRLAPSLERAAAAGGKILISTSQTLPVLTGAIGDLLDSFTRSSAGSATSLNLLIITVSGAIEAFSMLNTAVTLPLQGLGLLAEKAGLVGENVKHLDTINRQAAAGAGLTAQQYALLTGGLTNTAVAAKALDDAFRRLFDEQMGVDQANLAVNVGMQALRETIKGNKKTLDESTESGAQNTQVILQQIQALEQKREADIAAGNGTVEATQKANAAYAANVAALRAVLIQLGLAPAAVDALISAYSRIPTSITTTITTVYRTVGNKSGISDEATGHARTGNTDYGGIDGWRPAQFAAAGRGGAFAATGGGGYSPAVQVHSELSATFELDGKPFRAMVQRTTTAAGKRDAWRGKVGRR